MERKINKHEDAVAIYFKVGFIDEDMYSLTVDTAYGDASARIVEKKELDEFLKDWQICIKQKLKKQGSLVTPAEMVTSRCGSLKNC